MLNYPVERNDNFLSLIASSVRKQIIGGMTLIRNERRTQVRKLCGQRMFQDFFIFSVCFGHNMIIL